MGGVFKGGGGGGTTIVKQPDPVNRNTLARQKPEDARRSETEERKRKRTSAMRIDPATASRGAGGAGVSIRGHSPRGG